MSPEEARRIMLDTFHSLIEYIDSQAVEIEQMRKIPMADVAAYNHRIQKMAAEIERLQEANTNFACQASDQAQEIERLRADLERQETFPKSTSGMAAGLHIAIRKTEEQAARIQELETTVSALREIAVEQRAAHIAFVGFHRNMNEDETKHEAQYEARRQLHTEHPEEFR